MMTSDLSQPEVARREKRLALQALGIDPYPPHAFEVSASTEGVLRGYEAGTLGEGEVSLAGRIMGRRVMGKTCFLTLQDEKGRLQLYVQRNVVCPGEDATLYDEVVKKLLDIGDIIGVRGVVFRTRTGEVSLKVTGLYLLAKSLKPLPDVKEVVEGGEKRRFNDFTNPEHRYRQRYVDLVVNPEVREVFRQRAKIVQTIRQHFDGRGYLEVETPVLQPLYGGAAARPFRTHHNALDMELYLRISNELYLKRLIVGGYDGVYEFSKDFRNEGMSRFHNPEFTQVEVYVAYQDYRWMMGEVERMLHGVALALHGTPRVRVGEHVLDFTPPWQRFTMYEAIAHFTGLEVAEMETEALRKVVEGRGVAVDEGAGRGKLLDELFSEACEPHLVQPTFITDYPVETSPLAKRHRDNPALVERFEGFVNGKELCNAYSELNDPIDQRERFEAQRVLAQQGDEEAMALDEDFLRAMAYGMPPTAGLGIGIDRLAMVMTNQPSIQDVLFFPQMRPQQRKRVEAEDPKGGAAGDKAKG